MGKETHQALSSKIPFDGLVAGTFDLIGVVFNVLVVVPGDELFFEFSNNIVNTLTIASGINQVQVSHPILFLPL